MAAILGSGDIRVMEISGFLQCGIIYQMDSRSPKTESTGYMLVPPWKYVRIRRKRFKSGQGMNIHRFQEKIIASILISDGLIKYILPWKTLTLITYALYSVLSNCPKNAIAQIKGWFKVSIVFTYLKQIKRQNTVRHNSAQK